MVEAMGLTGGRERRFRRGRELGRRMDERHGPVGKEPADLEQAADKLLTASGAMHCGTRVYTQAQLDRKIRLERQRLPVADEHSIPVDTLDYLAQSQLEDIIDVSRLTTRQEVAFRLSVMGLGIRDISATLRIQPQTATAALDAAKRKVRAAYKEGRYAGWYEVYLSEVNRPAYRHRK